MPGDPDAPRVGDPTRWGAEIQTIIPATGLQVTQQVLAAATRDAYSRSWSMLGTLSLPPDLWNAASGITVSLEAVMGVGQAQIAQRISLFDPTQNGGLCYAQYLPNGGPYESIPSHSSDGAVILSRSFAAIGALIGQSINIRARYSVAAIFPALPAVSTLTIIVAPYAPGSKL